MRHETVKIPQNTSRKSKVEIAAVLMRLSLLTSFLLCKYGYGFIGVDLSASMSATDWKSQSTTQPGFSFVVSHILFYNGTINPNGLESVITAWDYGIKDISLYMYPCIDSSIYATSNKIECGSAYDQFNTIWGAIRGENIKFLNHTTTKHFSPTASPTILPSITPTIIPSVVPTILPSVVPTDSPSPTISPTRLPTSFLPTYKPSAIPTAEPSSEGTSPSISPSQHPSIAPSKQPQSPSIRPSAGPTLSPTTSHPSFHPTPGFRNHTTVRSIFVNVEDETPNRYFSGDAAVNIKFLADFANAAMLHGVQVGVYTTQKDWFNVMTRAHVNKTVIFNTDGSGTSYTVQTKTSFYPLPNNTVIHTNPFKHLPLWLPRYDSIDSMAFFKPFADWDQVYMKQTSGGAASLRRIGTSRVCTNYKDQYSKHYDNVTLSLIFV